MWLTFHVQTCFTSVEIETVQFHHLLIGFKIQALRIIAELSSKGIVLKTVMFLLHSIFDERSKIRDTTEILSVPPNSSTQAVFDL